MGRARKQEEGVLDALFDIFTMVPIWVGPCFAVIVFAVMYLGLPWYFSEPEPGNAIQKPLYGILSNLGPMLAPLIAPLILVVWLVAEIKKRSNSQRLDLQSDIESIRNLSWLEFEQLLAEVFRRQQYKVNFVESAGADGGIDIQLSKDDEVTLVQCKQWKVRKVGVSVVRELLGVMTSEGADAGIVVTSGRFTTEAIAFARDNSIRLIDGDSLYPMILAVQRSRRPSEHRSEPTTVTPEPAKPRCPKCMATMVLRIAKKGPNPGSQFWGCSNYPDCRGIRNL